MDPEDGSEKSPRIPESVLKAALLRRAVEDIDRLIQIKSAKQACSSLLQRGSVGDDLWQRFERGEKEMEEELRDVVTEVRFFESSQARLRHLAILKSCLTARKLECSNTSVAVGIRITVLTKVGQRSRPQLGPVHLPIRPRNLPKQQTPRPARRSPRPSRRGKGLVGEAPRPDPDRVHEGAGRRGRGQVYQGPERGRCRVGGHAEPELGVGKAEEKSEKRQEGQL